MSASAKSGSRTAHRLLRSLLLLMAIGPAVTASAVPLTFVYAGVVHSVDDPQNLINDSVTAGTPFEFAFTFDSDAPDERDTGDPWSRFYISTSPSSHISLTVGSYTFREDAGVFLSVLDDDLMSGVIIDRYEVMSPSFDISVAGPDSNLLYAASFAITMIHHSGTALSSTSLPLVPPDPNDFTADPTATLAWGCAASEPTVPRICPNGGWDIHYKLSSLRLVPEPRLALVVVALGSIVGRLRLRTLGDQANSHS